MTKRTFKVAPYVPKNNPDGGSVVIKIDDVNNNNNNNSNGTLPSQPPPSYKPLTTEFNGVGKQTLLHPSSSSASRSQDLNWKASVAAPATFSAHNLNFYVKVKDKFYKSAHDKQILHNITAVFGQGMNAILGPSGCGKSSLLDVLAGRVDEERMKGTLLLNSKPTPKNFKCMVGYVVQDDVIMGTLTVRENFAFSAALRLPDSVTAAERKTRVEDTIKELGLTSCADTKIGNELIRGVSGGQRKRCNIGMELIINPPLLFLDEPTTGLDANTASNVLVFLKRLSQRGRTIIFSIHQPRYAIYRMFDNLLLLSAGHTIYNGPADQALTFFQQQGYECQEHNNPPDFFLDVINGDPSTLGLDECGGGGDAMQDEEDSRCSMEEQIKAKHDALVKGFKSSSWNQDLQDDASAIYSNYKELHDKEGHVVERIGYATSFWTQIAVVSKRTVKNVLRNPQNALATFMTVLFFSLFVTALFFDLSDEPERAVNGRQGVLFFTLTNQVLLNMASVEVFIGERKFFLHENVTGYYRVSVYFFIKIFCDILPLRLLPVFIQACIIYYTIGFRPGSVYFFKFVGSLFSITLSATGLCFLFSAIFKVFSVTQLLVSLTYVVMMLFCGFLVDLEAIVDWLEWLKYFSCIRYGLNNLFLIEFKDRTFCSSRNDSTPCVHGNDFLRSQYIDFEDDMLFWNNIIINFAFFIGFLILTYINLRIVKKHR